MLGTLWVSNKYLLYEPMNLMIESLFSSHLEIDNFRLITIISTSQGHRCIFYKASCGKELGETALWFIYVILPCNF